jgi:uncharacterized protein (TIGR02996 family)
MADQEAFQRTINENPHDDGPRLVYADWLEENGECDKAELLRIGCERNRLANAGASPKKLSAVAKREDEIQANHPAWPADLPKLSRTQWGPRERGFVSTIRISDTATFLRHAPKIFVAAPITQVWLDALDDDGAAALAASPWLARLVLLKSHGTHIGDVALKTLVDSPHVANLKRLFITSAGIGDTGARAIARSRSLGKLTTLFLNSNRIGNDGALALADTKRLPALREVYLAANEVRDAGTAALRNRWGENAHL